MLSLFWNAGASETIAGVDMLGVRRFDQDLERRWVAGITTVSQRARYLSLIPWAIAEYYRRALAAGDGRSCFEWSQLSAILGRLEFVTLAATSLGRDGAYDYGTIGKDSHGELIRTLRAGEPVSLDSISGGSSYNTYIGPCRSFQILRDAQEAARPIQILALGQSIHSARQVACAESRLAAAVFDGGVVDRLDFAREGHLFDLNGLSGPSARGERKWLMEAFLHPGGALDPARGERFRGTVAWILDALADESMSAWMLVKSNYERCAEEPATTRGPAELSFFEYELRRRVHFALELLLRATTRTLQTLVEATIPEITLRWTDASLPTDSKAFRLVRAETWQYSATLGDFVSGADPRAFIGEWVVSSEARALSSGQQALYALALVVACDKHSRVYRDTGRLPDRTHAVERVFSLLREYASRRLPEALEELTRELVVARHLHVTLRKMGNGQKCSLRFYPEGRLLRPTGTGVRAGFSGTRLANVFEMLADLGILERLKDHTLRPTPVGLALRGKLES